MAGRPFVLRADLSAGTVQRERVPDEWRRRFLGGKGLGARYLYEELDPGIDPLGPDNLLGFFTGPLSGYLAGETRYAAVTKSPLTGGFLDSYAGGSFAERLAGSLDDCVALLVTGVAADPVRIELSDGTGSIEPATDWGADTVETAERHPDAAVACIGPAGENRVAYATIASDGGEHHAGRGGAGAVMGAKRLKAVVAHDDPPAVPASLRSLYERDAEAFAETDTGKWQIAGETLESVDFANEVGALATEGWQRGQFEGADDIGIEAARNASVARENPEKPVPGGFRVETDDGTSVPRGATPMSLGAGLGVDDFDAVTALGDLCDRLGLDVISAGNAVAWAVRANDAGLVDCEVAFGDDEAASALLWAIATGDGSPDGDDDTLTAFPPDLVESLQSGVDIAAERFGGTDFIPAVKSMTLPAYDPRVAAGMALAYATSDRGACHRRARPIEVEVFEADWSTRERVGAVVAAQEVRSILWSLVADDFAGEILWDDCGAEWLRTLDRTVDPPGLDAETMRRRGERIWTLIRLFNAREGFTRADDRLPETLTNPVANGPNAGRAIDPVEFENLLDAYYTARGWGPEGLPTRATIDRLDLLDTIDGETPLETVDGETPLGESTDPNAGTSPESIERIDDDSTGDANGDRR